MTVPSHPQARNWTAALLAGALLALFLAWQAGATHAEQRRAEPVAVAVVNLEKTMDGLQEVRALNADFQRRVQRMQETLNELETQAEAIQADIETLELTRDERRDKQRELFELNALAEARSEALTQFASVDQGTIIRDVYVKVKASIADIARREGYDIVLLDDRPLQVPRNAPFSEVNRVLLNKTILFAGENVDITDRVITQMNNEFAAQ